MSFLVYLFVLIVAAGSVIFGLDWTQAPLNPPPYATPPSAQTTAAGSAGVPAAKAAPATTASVAAANKSGFATSRDEAARAQARATDQPETTAAVAHCNVSACSASYQSFRAADCTYQPYDGPRRVCTRTSAKAAAATRTHSTRSAHVARRDEPRLTDRRDYRDYQSDRGGWNFGIFGNDDER